MREDDRRLFAMAANSLKYWILVRQINPASTAYFGREGFTPKPIDCKAKTADSGRHAGLVIEFPHDDMVARQVYGENKLAEALKCWKDFAAGPLVDPERSYAIERRNPDFLGCVTLGGKYVYGDYDLYDVVDPGQARRNFAVVDALHGQLHMRSPYHYRVMAYINAQFQFPVVQHSGEAQYKDHSNQFIDVFGPNFEYFPLQNEAEIRRFYNNYFEGRKALGKGVKW
jgi:hypothetical protein